MRKMFCPDIKSGHDIFDMRGIDRGLCDFLADDPKSPVREIHASRARISMQRPRACRAPEAWFAESPRSSRPIEARTVLRAPSQPTT
jgi:hypothetical protein